MKMTRIHSPIKHSIVPNFPCNQNPKLHCCAALKHFVAAEQQRTYNVLFTKDGNCLRLPNILFELVATIPELFPGRMLFSQVDSENR